MFNYSSARIVADSPLWTGENATKRDWYSDAAKTGVINGIPYSQDDGQQRFIDAPRALEGDVPGFMDFENV
jgi:hypothetical protein